MDFSSIDCFADLTDQQRSELLAASNRLTVSAGEVLMREGESSDSMYFVLSGRFSVHIEGHDGAIAEISAGQSIGEIGFLSGEPRTATTSAVRDSVVLALSVEQFDRLCDVFPDMLKSVSVSLARKLAAATNAYRNQPYSVPATLAVIPAGGAAMESRFLTRLCDALKNFGGVKVLHQEDVPCSLDDAEELAQWLNRQEAEYGYLIYQADAGASRWTSLCLRQSDQFILVANAVEGETALNAAEQLALEMDGGSGPYLLLCHETSDLAEHSNRWLATRDPVELHHVAFDSPITFDRVVRFLNGTARGLVASGGGAFTAAQIGVFRAFEEAGIGFDIIGGASGGAAVGCSLAAGVDHQYMSEGTERMMVKSGALKRFTLPVYSLVDHRYFDAQMRENYGDRHIEDFWLRFFAVSTNLSSGELKVHQRGLLWKAVRASASIPGMLPPMISDKGDLLVDGGILDNVPLASMKSLKHGPNIVLCFEPRQQGQTDASYDELPGRAELLKRVVQPGKALGADMPRIGAVLTQCMLLNNTSMTEATDSDLILWLRLPDDLKLNDWGRHKEMTEIGYQQARAWLAEHADDPVLALFREPGDRL